MPQPTATEPAIGTFRKEPERQAHRRSRNTVIFGPTILGAR